MLVLDDPCMQPATHCLPDIKMPALAGSMPSVLLIIVMHGGGAYWMKSGRALACFNACDQGDNFF